MTDKILIDRSVVEQALEALDEADLLMEHRQNIELRRSALVALSAALEQPQVEQEPVAWLWLIDGKRHSVSFGSPNSNTPKDWTVQPLYTHPNPPRQPLTDEQIGEIEGWFSNEFGLEAKHSIDFARAVEAAHGIKDTP